MKKLKVDDDIWFLYEYRCSDISNGVHHIERIDGDKIYFTYDGKAYCDIKTMQVWDGGAKPNGHCFLSKAEMKAYQNAWRSEVFIRTVFKKYLHLHQAIPLSQLIAVSVFLIKCFMKLNGLKIPQRNLQDEE